MDIPRDLDGLTALFTKLGAREAEIWARSQIDEGIPQLQRFLFLRQAWQSVVRDGDTSWIEGAVRHAQRNADSPYAAVGQALQRCLDAGASARDLTDIVRGMQAELLFGFCYLLDDPAFTEPELADVAWGLFEMDASGNPILPRIAGLHESVLETDPTGQEMRAQARS